MDPVETLTAAVAAALGVLVTLGVVRLRAPAPAPPSALGATGLPDSVAGVLSVVGGPAVVLDVADEVVRASPAAHATGLVRGASLAHPETLALVRAARRDGTLHERWLHLPRGRGGTGAAPLVLHARAAPLDTLHVLLLTADHSESARVEAVRRDFVVNVSHELKTPVAAIGLLAEAVEGAADDPAAVRRFASRMGVETRRLTQLVRDVVELSKVQVDDPVADPRRVDLVAVLEESVDRSRLTAADRGVTVDVVVDGDGDGETSDAAEAVVMGDADQLVTAVSNLVENAVRYSEAGTRVAVGLRLAEAVVEVTVTDQGIGIPRAEQQRVFERFYRADPARSRATGGTGLGLSIVKHVAAAHGGEVHLWSQVGQGSTFTLRLPAEAPRPPLAGATAARPAPQHVPQHTPEVRA